MRKKGFRAKSQSARAGQDLQDHPDKLHLIDEETEVHIGMVLYSNKKNKETKLILSTHYLAKHLAKYFYLIKPHNSHYRQVLL